MAIPLAYLITFRTYGTWLHGDERSSVDRRGHNVYGMPRIKPNASLKCAEAKQLKHEVVILDERQREKVEQAIREVCEHRGYELQAINVRSNHVHVVVAAACEPESVMNAFKAYSTRGLREAIMIANQIKPWERHGSTRYLLDSAPCCFGN